jgi:hypothetical protein
MCFGLPVPDPLVRGTDLDLDLDQDELYHQAKIVRKTLIPIVLGDFFMTFYFGKMK